MGDELKKQIFIYFLTFWGIICNVCGLVLFLNEKLIAKSNWYGVYVWNCRNKNIKLINTSNYICLALYSGISV